MGYQRPRNRELLTYYQGLIKLRNKYDAFRKAQYSNYKFLLIEENEFALAYELYYKNQIYFVIFNANTKTKLSIDLPEGWWKILTDENSIMKHYTKSVKGKIKLNPSTGMVLKKK